MVLLFKLIKVKEYLFKNLSKGFITSSKAPYSSLILFTLKSNKNLYFYIDYRKLNTLTKRNYYLLPLINKVINKIRGYLYLIRLDIISAFNKIRIDSNNKDYTTFTTILG